LANGTSTDYAYDLDGNLTRLHHEFNDGAATFMYSYDDSGNRTALTVDDNRYLFDDFAGMDRVVRYETNSLNQYTAVNDVTYDYDLGANLTSDGVHSYAYDAQNRLIACPDRSASYTYDPFGRRTAKTVDGTTTVYLHDGNRVIMEYDGASGEMLRRYVHGLSLDELVCMVTSFSRYYYHLDSLGSVIALSDDSGAVEERYAYSPFGIMEERSGVGNPYLYTGREYDEETGLYYYRARHYDPQLGRFLQPDPLGYVADMNAYSYVGNAPANFVDPLGLAKQYVYQVSRDLFSRAMKDLYQRKLVQTSPGYLDYIEFDSWFWESGDQGKALFEYEGQVLSGHEMNYYGIGMLYNQDAYLGKVSMYPDVYGWKGLRYFELPSDDLIHFLDRGYNEAGSIRAAVEHDRKLEEALGGKEVDYKLPRSKYHLPYREMEVNEDGTTVMGPILPPRVAPRK